MTDLLCTLIISLSVPYPQLKVGCVATALSNYHLLATYWSPSSNLPSFIDAIDNYCNECMKRNGLRIVAGDLNCNILDVALNSLEQQYLDVMSFAGFVSCIDKVTRPENSTCIDHYFIKLLYVLNASAVVCY